MAIPLLEIHLLLRDIDPSRLANGHCRQRTALRPLQPLEMLEQLTVRALEQGQEVFPEPPQRFLAREPVELWAILVAQLDL
jgi:hypothetical protein